MRRFLAPYGEAGADFDTELWFPSTLSLNTALTEPTLLTGLLRPMSDGDLIDQPRGAIAGFVTKPPASMYQRAFASRFMSRRAAGTRPRRHPREPLPGSRSWGSSGQCP